MITLHDLHLEDLQNKLHPSVFEEHQDYQILILRLPEQINNKFNFNSHGFIIIEKDVYHYDQIQANLVPFPNGLDDLYHFLDSKIDILMHDIESIQEEIALLEDALYQKFTSRFMEHWHAFKKELSQSERVIIKSVDTLELFITKSKTNASFPLSEFYDLHEHLERTLRSNANANDQLNNLYNYYTLRSNDRMNHSIYILTIISVIFLPLNLVVGFFGMNTGGLPFQKIESGTAYASITMILFTLGIIASVLWKIKKDKFSPAPE
ncbi:MAG: CorA family divalent cation transporter [Sulfuricurvum sp.]|nr:CorA family divalent cation transporter [Sulfuricurvum sp.]